eukprot:tig00001286_g8020.t1
MAKGEASPKGKAGKGGKKPKKPKMVDPIEPFTKLVGFCKSKGKASVKIPFLIQIVHVQTNKKEKTKEFQGRLYWTGHGGMQAFQWPPMPPGSPMPSDLWDFSVGDVEDPLNVASIRVEGQLKGNVLAFHELVNSVNPPMVTWGPPIPPPPEGATVAEIKAVEAAQQLVSRKPYYFEGNVELDGSVKGQMVGARGAQSIFEMGIHPGIFVFNDPTPRFGPSSGGTVVEVSCLGILYPGPPMELPDPDRLKFRITQFVDPENRDRSPTPSAAAPASAPHSVASGLGSVFGGVPGLPGGASSHGDDAPPPVATPVEHGPRVRYADGAFSLHPRQDPFPTEAREGTHSWKIRFTAPPALGIGTATIEVGFIPAGIEPIELVEPYVLELFNAEPDTRFVQIPKRKLLLTLSETMESAKLGTDLYKCKQKIARYPGTPETELLIVKDVDNIYGKPFYLCSSVTAYQVPPPALALGPFRAPRPSEEEAALSGAQEEAARLSADAPPPASPFVALPTRFSYYSVPTEGPQELDMEPTSGPVTGGTNVLITGSRFVDTGLVAVEIFDGSTRRVVEGEYISEYAVRFVTPSCDYDGPVQVSVSFNGQQFVPLKRIFSYHEPIRWQRLDIAGFGYERGYASRSPDRSPSPGADSMHSDGRRASSPGPAGAALGVGMSPSPSRTLSRAATSAGSLGAAVMPPTRRSAAAMAVVTRRLYLFGGAGEPKETPLPPAASSSLAASAAAAIQAASSEGALASRNILTDLYMYDIALREWTRLATSGVMPHPRPHCRAAFLGHRVFLFGAGFGYGPESTEVVYILDTNTRKWEEVPTRVAGGQPFPKFTGAVLVQLAPHRLALVGGTEFRPTLATLDAEAMEWALEDVEHPALLGSRTGHTATLVSRRLFVFGGRLALQEARRPRGGPEPPPPPPTNDLLLLDLDEEKLTWNRLRPGGTPPSARTGHCACRIGHRIYIFGGEDAAGRQLADLHCLDLKSLAWSEVHVSSPPDFGPTGREEATACTSNNTLFVFGGWDGRQRLDDMYELRVDESVRSQKEVHGAAGAFVLGAPPSARAAAAHALVGRFLYVHGGYFDVWQNVADMHRLNLDAHVWEPVPYAGGPAPAARHGHTATLVGRRLFVFGGALAAGKALNDLSLFDLDTGTWFCPTATGDVPPPVYAHSAVLRGRSIVVYGGCHQMRKTADIYLLNVDTYEWRLVQTKGERPEPTFGHSATLLEDARTMLVFGGCTRKDAFSDAVYTLDLETLTWRREELLGRTPSGRMGHTCVLYGGRRLLLFGGHAAGDRASNDDLWVLDLEKREWRERSGARWRGLLAGRWWHAAALSDCMLVLFGGQSSAWKFLNDVYTICCCEACL